MKPVELKITAAVASALLVAGCGQDQPPNWVAQQDTAVCINRAGGRLPDANCGRGYAGGGGGGGRWYYLGRGSSVPYYGERVAGGSFTRTSGATYFHAPVTTAMTRSAAIARGGFGASARSFGGFGE